MMTVVASSSWGGLGWLWIPFGALMMIGCMLMMGWMMGGMMHHDEHGGRGWRNRYYGQRPDANDRAQRPESAEQILADRLARGQIDVEEYNRLLAAIHPNPDPDRGKAAAHSGD